MKTKILSVLFFLSGIAFILLKLIPGFTFELAVKAIIIPFLILIFIINIRPDHMIAHWLMFSALTFSWAGDVVLDFPGQPGNSFSE